MCRQTSGTDQFHMATNRGQAWRLFILEVNWGSAEISEHSIQPDQWGVVAQRSGHLPISEAGSLRGSDVVARIDATTNVRPIGAMKRARYE